MSGFLEAVSVATRTYSLFKEVITTLRRQPSSDPRVRRWIEASRAHDCDTVDVFTLLGNLDVSVAMAYNASEIAHRLTPQVLAETCRLWNIRIDWLCGRDDRIYELMTLDRSLSSLVDDLLDWKREGTDHALFVFKSRRAELELDLYQQGALVMGREVGKLGDQPIYAYRPIYSLEWWPEPKQRWLALRAIWAAWHMSFNVFGCNASERQCKLLSEGRGFPGSVLKSRNWLAWHPDDYVVRPSARAKGASWIDGIIIDHDRELTTLLANARTKRRNFYCASAT